MRLIAAILLLLNLNGCATMSSETRLSIGFSIGVLAVPGAYVIYDYFRGERNYRNNRPYR